MPFITHTYEAYFESKWTSVSKFVFYPNVPKDCPLSSLRYKGMGTLPLFGSLSFFLMLAEKNKVIYFCLEPGTKVVFFKEAPYKIKLFIP